MSNSLTVVALTAASIGFLHTLFGPDHYVPFVMMARAGRWSRAKTVAVTLGCGLAHLLSSVVLGAIGIALGVVVSRLEVVESFRGRLAAWLLIAFGLVYFVWGVRRALRRRPHTHRHAHADGTVHVHAHAHELEHSHAHAAETGASASPVATLTPWILFTIFIFGPCEPLIPLVMYPAAQKTVFGVVLVTTVFAATTLATMLAAVLACQSGLERLPLGFLDRYTHALAGAALALCGLAIQFLGL